MVVTLDTVIVGVDDDLTPGMFERVLRERNSPVTEHAACWAAVVSHAVSPAAMLAFFWKESQFATDPGAVVVRYDTKNPGNCRSSRTGRGTVINTNKGPFVTYDSWIDGWEDMAYRLVDPAYVYVREGRRTIRDIVARFAPTDDGNDPAGYAQTVVNLMNRWIESDTPMAGDDPRFTWRPDVTEFGYPTGSSGRSTYGVDLLIVHITAGTNSSGWLRGNNGSSTHYLTDRQLRPFEQHVREADAAWTAGNRVWNLRGINVEAEKPATEPWTQGQIRAFAATCHPICARHNIPFVYLGRDSAAPRRGLIGHADVPDPYDGNRWGGSSHHTDPGPSFDWGLFVAELRALDTPQPEPPPNPNWPRVPVTERDPWRDQFGGNPYGRDKWIPQVFVSEIRLHEWHVTGFVVSEAFAETGDDGQVRVVQYFERARLELAEDGTVTRGLVGREVLWNRYPERRPA